jgi:hypothetical protein
MSRKPGVRGQLTAPVHVKLTPIQREALDAAAVVRSCSAPEVIRVALDELLAREQRDLRPVLATIRRARRKLSE